MLVASQSRRMALTVLFIIYDLSVLSSVVGEELCDQSLQITYDHVIQCNEQLDVSKMVDKPVVIYGYAKPDSLYTVVLKDLGSIVKRESTFEESILWLDSNSKGNSLKNGQLDGVELRVYDGPDAASHLYRFVVLEQLNGTIEISTEVREILNLPTYIIDNNLQEVGKFDLRSM